MTTMGRPGVAIAIVGALAFGVLVGYLVSSLQHLYPRYAVRVVEGHVEAPLGTAFDRLTVVASRGDQTITGGSLGNSGEFSFPVPGDDPIDLQVGEVSGDWPDHQIRGSLLPLVAGSFEGFVRGVPAGARGVTIRLVPLVAKSITVRVTASAGESAAGARVAMWSMADSVENVADTSGRARFDRMPVRRWRVRVILADRPSDEFVYGVGNAMPDDGEVEVTVPRGIAVRVRIAGRIPTDVVLHVDDPFGSGVWELPWRPGADGTMTIVVSRSQESVSVAAYEYFDRTSKGGYSSRRFAEAVVAVREGAEVVLMPMER
jgi:hypothetical protein